MMKWVKRPLCQKAVFMVLFLAVLLAAPASSQQNEPTMLIGLIPEMNIFKQKQRFDLLGDYLSKKTGVKIRFTILSRYGNIIERFVQEKMDGAFFGSFTGSLAIQKLSVVPIARPVNLDNTSAYNGYIFVKRGNGITNAKEMRGRRMAFVEKATTAGYIFPLAYFRDNGITTIEGYFSEYFFTGSHDAAIHAVLNGKADIGAAKHSVYLRVRKEDPRVDKELVILAQSQWVPSNGLCVRKDLDPVLRGKLKDALLNLDKDPAGKAVLEKFGALRFIDTTAGDYRPVHELVEKAGIDLAKYDYQNE